MSNIQIARSNSGLQFCLLNSKVPNIMLNSVKTCAAALLKYKAQSSAVILEVTIDVNNIIKMNQ